MRADQSGTKAPAAAAPSDHLAQDARHEHVGVDQHRGGAIIPAP
jgi:hypothetical protein